MGFFLYYEDILRQMHKMHHNSRGDEVVVQPGFVWDPRLWRSGGGLGVCYSEEEEGGGRESIWRLNNATHCPSAVPPMLFKLLN